jgi:putative ABC transport system permease protein
MTPVSLAFAPLLGDAVRTGAGVELSWLDLGIASALVLVAAGIAMWQRIGLARGFLWGGVRALVQLVAVGYILTWVFTLDRWYVVLLALLVMLLAATVTITGRHRAQRRTVGTIAGVAMLLGAGLTLAYVELLVVRVTPWYDPRYLVPLFGMIVGNAMNGAALAAERLASEMTARRAEIEAYLSLGASPAEAAREPVRLALRAALLPAVNSLMVVGLVTLPGMMTGQILAGASPLLAVRYQVVVVFMLAGAVAITSAIVVLLYRRTFFAAAEQLATRVPV